ncbi:carboxypeptidase-like regulatory domain-containing protein [Parachryseolinea silvisoli]|uniref:carboxypeptidase-like regulatory domain-containing protein n=1 Tax=Parachryseolinea silvisoli TaxID=2873601 RepID=UPI002265BC21|nr:carboxypeptidase-like regulatory domain-containing protein [Parachryseolinea silvisoli]MCD9015585.1 carboxypeptidase-like regulatory domain-containing protein [Parachryseolinea silvisoli]
MKKSVSLSIPRPCAESWNNFTPTPEGGFCGSCQKTVIDFTRMSDRQILDYLAKKRVHTCGRFRADQLKTYTFPEPNSIRPGFTLLRAGVLGLLLLFTGRSASAKNTVPVMPTVEMTQSASHPIVGVEPMARAEQWIKGVVRDETGEPLPGVSVIRKGTTQGTNTDADGRFEFPYELKAGDVLTFSFIGYTSIDYVVPETAPDDVKVSLPVDISLEMDVVIMGELVSDAPYSETPAPIAPKR